jgi:hypothetical protein
MSMFRKHTGLQEQLISLRVLLLVGLLAGLFVTGCRKKANLVITLDGREKGLVFEGIGAVSAGASSRLLIDYPEPYRSQILDYLFKPDYGASLQHLKVEIGGDENSTDGSEPSFARSRAEMAHPDLNRGYEWWLMEEAQKRNPNIILDSLAWGAPGWIGNGRFYSQDMADYAAKFVEGAKSAHHLDVSYTGVWNETRYDIGYVKFLKGTLLAHNLPTKLVCCDLYTSMQQWSIIADMQKDPQLKEAVDVVGVHYPRVKGVITTPEAAKEFGKPLWSSEDQPLVEGGPNTRDWSTGGRGLAQIYNTNYIVGRFTKTETWSPITSYYDILAAPHSGLMYANTPWSGHYDVQSAIWVTAQTTQFAQPGWQYIDSACGFLPGKGSYVTLKFPTSGDYSVILETVDAKTPLSVTFRITGSLSLETVHIWETNATKNLEHIADVTPQNGVFDFTFDPDSIYSLTSTTGQGKGTARPSPAAPFPYPFAENFESTDIGRSPRYFADQNGAFEAQSCHGLPGRCLEQVITRKPIPWGGGGEPVPDPYTVLGSVNWTDYTVSVDAMLEQPGNFTLEGRIDDANAFEDQKARFPAADILVVNQDGSWQLDSTRYKSPTVKLAAGKVGFPVMTWHHLVLKFQGPTVTASIDGKIVANVKDTTHSKGMVGIGTGWNKTQFDNFMVRE